LNHLWSLPVEEVFYLFFPLLIAATRTRSHLRSTVLIALVIYGPIFRSRLTSPDVYSFFGNFDLLAMGCLAAIHAPQIKRWHADMRWIGATLIAMTFFATVLTLQWTLPPTLVGAGTVLYLLGSTSTEPTQPSMLFEPLQTAGRLSYEMYLFAADPVVIFSGSDPHRRPGRRKNCADIR
jgi:peptidoglycan/LPS O-acetylase OafA/YrhL